MPSHPLDGVALKLERANDQLHNLKAELDTFFKGEPYGLISANNPDILELFFLADERRALPPMWSVLIGEIGHNLRSALDHLVWQLVIKETGAPPPSKQTQFPIFQSLAGYESDRGEVFRLVGVGTKARALIKSSQPFATGEGKASPLWHLHELSNWDKHNNIPLTVVMRKSLSIEGEFDVVKDLEYLFATPPGPIKHHTVLGGARLKPSATPFEERAAKVKMKGGMSMNVAFEEPAIMAGLQIIDGLRAMRNSVAGITGQIENEIF